MFENYERHELTIPASPAVYWFDPANQRAHVRIGGQQYFADATEGTRETVARNLLAKHLIQPRDEVAA